MPTLPSQAHSAHNVVATRVGRVVLLSAPEPWSFPQSEQALIDAHWRRAVAANPKYFNGTVYTLLELALAEDDVRATLAPIAFRQFLYWRENGQPDVGIRDAYGAAIVRSREGHVLLVRAAAGTLTAGRYTFVTGFIDRNDRLPDGTLDLLASTRRELGEETGLGVEDLLAEPGFIVVDGGGAVMFGVVYRSNLDANTLRKRMLRFAQAEAAPEIDDVRIVNRLDDVLMQQIQPATAAALRIVLGPPATNAATKPATRA